MQNEKTYLYPIHFGLEVLFTHRRFLSQRLRFTSINKHLAFSKLWVLFFYSNNTPHKSSESSHKVWVQSHKSWDPPQRSWDPPQRSWDSPQRSWGPPHKSWGPPHKSWGPPHKPRGQSPNKKNKC